MMLSSCALELGGAKAVFRSGGEGKIPSSSSSCLLLNGNNYKNKSCSLRLQQQPSSRRRPRPRAEAAALLTTANQAQALGHVTSSSQFICLDPSPSPRRDHHPSYYYYSKSKRGHEKEEEERNREAITPKKMDEWMRDSITEIVRNIEEAPLLALIFSNQGRRSSRRRGTSLVRLGREAAALAEECWPCIKKSWDQEDCTPDGVILVEELKDKEEEEEEEGGRWITTTGGREAAARVWGGIILVDEKEEGSAGWRAEEKVEEEKESPTSTRTWGLVIQGRGMDCAPACYILKTTRVRSSGVVCTHISLLRAKCFGGPAQMQLRKAWLCHG